MGKTPNARPFGKGIKFTPTEDQEYRLVQNYLTELEKTEKISWFSYSLPQDRSLKVAIRGVPVETNPDEIADELRTLGFVPELVRPIKARKGRPGCIFFAILQRTANLIPDIYNISELLCMPGVRIEAWRGKKGPAQCHRCQKFRHSSHNCHRTQACVRCGEEHSAHDCPRPKEEPATCANCGGPHPANNLSCPVFRREARNKRAGTVASTTASVPSAPAPSNADVDGVSSAAPTAGANIRTPANDPTSRDAQPKKAPRKKKTRKGKKATTAAAPDDNTAHPPPRRETGNGRLAVIETAMQILSDVLHALRAGDEPADVILRGMSNLLKLNSCP